MPASTVNLIYDNQPLTIVQGLQHGMERSCSGGKYVPLTLGQTVGRQNCPKQSTVHEMVNYPPIKKLQLIINY